MEVELGKIFTKRDDYKVCENCQAINFHTNSECHSCDKEDFTSTHSYTLHNILNNIYAEYQDEGLEDSEIDKIEIQV